MSEKGHPPDNLPIAPREQNSKTAPGDEESQRTREKNKEEKAAVKDQKKYDSDEIRDHAKRDFFVVLGIFVVVVVLFLLNFFLLSGSEDSSDEESEAEQNKPSLLTSAENEASFYQGWIELGRGTARSAFYPGREYITIDIVQENLSYLFLSDWSLMNGSGETFELGEASYTPLRGETNSESSIIVDAGDQLIISSGDSPIGVSFRENACSGYLEQFQNFVPSINKTQCPDVTETLPDDLGGRFSNSTCENYIENTTTCEAVVDPLPNYLSQQCKDFIETEKTYNACVATYRDDPNFPANTWRVFLDQDNELWAQEDETITLLDSEGKVVDQISY